MNSPAARPNSSTEAVMALSVVGFDDTSISRLARVGLTTVAQDVDTLATRAIGRAIERIEGPRSGTGR